MGNVSGPIGQRAQTARAKTKQQAQTVLERYLCVHNRRLSKPALNAQPAWKKVSTLQIDPALCFKDRRTVAKDNTITFEGTVFQIPKQSPFHSYANKRIDVHVLLDGAVELFYQNEKIAAFDAKQRTHLAYIERTASRRGSGYGPISIQSTLHQELPP